MSRLLFSLWFGAALTTLVSFAVYELATDWFWTDEELQWMEDRVAPGFTLAVESIRREGGGPEQLAELERRFKQPVTVLDVEALPKPIQDQLTAGEDIAWDALGERAYLSLDQAHVVRFDRPPDYPTRHLASRFVVIALSLSVFLAIFWLLLWHLRSEQGQLRDAAEGLAQGDLSRRVPEGQLIHPELTRAFNHMAERTQVLVESQRSLLRAVGHELRTPIARAQLSVELLARSEETEVRARRAEEVQEDLEALNALVSELLDHARLTDTQPRSTAERIELADLIEGVEARAAELGCDLEVDAPSEAWLLGEPREVARALDNLLRNAARFAEDRVRLQVTQDDTHLVIRVEDDGPGFSVAEPEGLLAPFVTAGPGAGHGLGLAIVAQILKRHNGALELGRSVLGGAEVVTRWPLSPRPSTPRVSQPPSALGQGPHPS